MLRHRARLTRDALAEAAGVSAGAISNYENDVSAPAAATLRRMALVLAQAVDADRSELWDQIGDVLDRQSRAAQ
jgi:transcriptional regulator with XRE-family HTH domain